MQEFRTTRAIDFADTDMGGIVHFSRYLVYMETAEHECLRALGLDVVAERGGETVCWPRVRASCEYRSPLRFGDVVDIAVRVARRGARSLTWSFRLAVGDREVARGEMVTVCCAVAPGGGVRSIPIPERLAERLGAG